MSTTRRPAEDIIAAELNRILRQELTQGLRGIFEGILGQGQGGSRSPPCGGSRLIGFSTVANSNIKCNRVPKACPVRYDRTMQRQETNLGLHPY